MKTWQRHCKRRKLQTSVPHEHGNKTQNISQLSPATHKKGNITTKWGSYHKRNVGSIFKFNVIHHTNRLKK